VLIYEILIKLCPKFIENKYYIRVVKKYMYIAQRNFYFEMKQ